MGGNLVNIECTSYKKPIKTLLFAQFPAYAIGLRRDKHFQVEHPAISGIKIFAFLELEQKSVFFLGPLVYKYDQEIQNQSK